MTDEELDRMLTVAVKHGVAEFTCGPLRVVFKHTPLEAPREKEPESAAPVDALHMLGREQRFPEADVVQLPGDESIPAQSVGWATENPAKE